MSQNWKWSSAGWHARYTLNRYHDRSSVTGMLSHLQWEPLQLCRLHSKLCMVYKSIHGIACIPIYEYLEPKPRMTKHDFQFQVPNTRVDCYKYSFFPSIVHPWNNLSREIVAANTYSQFKGRLRGLGSGTLSG